MTTISWNCHILARGPAVRALRALIRKVNPVIVFVMETKLSDSAFANTSMRLRFQNFLSVPSLGLRGGLVLLWRPNVDFDVIHSSTHLISIMGGLMEDFAIYFVYGPTRWQDKILFWHQLSQLVSQGPSSGICLGNFNDLLFAHDKRGGKPFRSSSSRGLRSFMESYGAVDLGFVG